MPVPNIAIMIKVLQEELLVSREILNKFLRQLREGVPNLKEATINSSLQSILEVFIKITYPDILEMFGSDPVSKAAFRDIAKVFSTGINAKLGIHQGNAAIAYTNINITATIIRASLKTGIQISLMKGIDGNDKEAKENATFWSNNIADTLSTIISQLERSRQMINIANNTNIGFTDFIKTTLSRNPTDLAKNIISSIAGACMRYYPNKSLSELVFKKGISLAVQIAIVSLTSQMIPYLYKCDNKENVQADLFGIMNNIFEMLPQLLPISALASGFSKFDMNSLTKQFNAGQSHYESIFSNFPKEISYIPILAMYSITKIVSEMVTTTILSPPARIINNYLSTNVISIVFGIAHDLYNLRFSEYDLSFKMKDGTQNKFTLIVNNVTGNVSVNCTSLRTNTNNKDNLEILNQKTTNPGHLTSKYNKNIAAILKNIASNVTGDIDRNTVSLTPRKTQVAKLASAFKDKKQSVILNPVSITLFSVSCWLHLSNLQNASIFSMSLLACAATSGLVSKYNAKNQQVANNQNTQRTSLNHLVKTLVTVSTLSVIYASGMGGFLHSQFMNRLTKDDNKELKDTEQRQIPEKSYGTRFTAMLGFDRHENMAPAR
jgi:hypothetical protein